MAFGFCSLAAGTEVGGEAALKAQLPEIFAKAAAHYKALDAAATPLMKNPKLKGGYGTPHGWRTDKKEPYMCSLYWWTAGHYPGSLWHLYEATGEEFFRKRATEWTEIVAPNAKVTDNHDVGFIMYCSFGNARRLLNTDRYDALLFETAGSLSKRFNEGLGLIRSWGKIEDPNEFLVIPDNMMNLEILEWAAKHPSPTAPNAKEQAAYFDKVARSHADVTMKHHFRADGGAYHVLNYCQKDGRVQEIRRGQGASCYTAWSRGQSWAIYGYTMMYRETREKRYLDFAQKLADYAINHPNMPADGIPLWDYGAPGEERDSSAGAIMASALVELAGLTGGEKGASYRAFAVKQLLALASPAYFSEGDEVGHFLLKHGVGNKPGFIKMGKGGEVDAPLDYGDYYFLEALLRFRRTIADGTDADWVLRGTRGDAQALYGSTASYRSNGLVCYLDFARKLADRTIAHPDMPADGIPYLDAKDPGKGRDVVAGAMIAAALVELSQYVDAESRARYRAFADKQLRALASPPYPGKDNRYCREALARLGKLKAAEAERASLAAQLPEEPRLPGADKTGWAALAAHPDAARIIAYAEAAAKKPVPDAKDECYLEFWTTGNRSHYQAPYFERLNMLVTMTVAEALERKGRFLPRIIEMIDVICAMRTWILPAHDRPDHERGNFRGTAINVDLFSSQVASHLAYTVNYLGDALPPETVAKIRREAERRIFAPLRLSYSFTDAEGHVPRGQDPLLNWWICGGNNWNAVCHDNVVTAALALLDDRSDRAFFVAHALRGLTYYARQGFAADGYCLEGMGYWNYGFGHLLMLGLTLRDLTGGRIDIFTEPAYRRAAEYAHGYQLEPGVSPAFADGNGAPSAANLALVRRVWPDLTCRAAETVSPFGSVTDGVAGLYTDHHVALLGFGQTAPAAAGAAEASLPPRSVFPVAQVWVMRLGEELSVAIKGGSNGEPHGHNDVGSYYLASRGKLLSGDPGAEEYTARTFSAKRYESKVLSSYAHPVPVVGGCLQPAGGRFAAKVLKTDFSDARDVVVLDLAGAYDVKTLKALTRTFVFDRAAKTFSVTDKVSFSSPTAFEEVYTTFAGEKFGKVEVAVKASGRTVQACEHVDNPNRISPDRHSVRFEAPVTEAEITLTFRAQPAA